MNIICLLEHVFDLLVGQWRTTIDWINLWFYLFVLEFSTFFIIFGQFLLEKKHCISNKLNADFITFSTFYIKFAHKKHNLIELFPSNWNNILLTIARKPTIFNFSWKSLMKIRFTQFFKAWLWQPNARQLNRITTDHFNSALWKFIENKAKYSLKNIFFLRLEKIRE